MDLNLLETLTQVYGPSGYEDLAREAILSEVGAYADETRVDALGSLVAVRRGSDENPGRVLLAAHMDEIGAMVTHVEEKGYLRFTGIGGVRALSHVGQRVRFADGSTGTIYVERMDHPKLPEVRHLYIDVGASSRDDCPVSIGDTATFVGPLVQQGSRLVSKAMDDRIGCYILVEVLRRLKGTPHDVYVTFTTQEEITLSGARTSAYGINPAVAISVDVTTTGDLPKSLPMEVSLGGGPAVKVKDAGMVAHPRVRDALVQAAQRADVPYQLEVLSGGTTDAAAMQLVRSGVPSGCLSIPCRYVHSTAETVDQGDVANAIEVLLALLANPI